VTNIEHADNVEHADHADRVDNVLLTQSSVPLAARVLIAGAVFMFALSLAIIIAYLAPAVGRLSHAVGDLSGDTAFEKEQDDCYDRHTALITEGNARVLARIGDLVVLLSTPPRDQAAIDLDIKAIDDAAATYDAAIDARADWVADGKQVPCPIPVD
jgi:hypothetical protein